MCFSYENLNQNVKESVLSQNMLKNQYFIKCLGRNELYSFWFTVFSSLMNEPYPLTIQAINLQLRLWPALLVVSLFN